MWKTPSNPTGRPFNAPSSTGNEPISWSKIALILYNTGKKEEAMKLLETSLEMEPEDWAGARKVIDGIKADETSHQGDASTS
jgi:predicted TPR repeat methyltransferase